MSDVLSFAAPLIVFIVFIILCLGLWNMMRGKDPNLSQKLMRWRVFLQFIAIIVLMTLLYFTGK